MEGHCVSCKAMCLGDDVEPIQPVSFCQGRLCLIDQRWLPADERRVEYDDPADVARAIKEMVVRGAPAIGIAAGFAMVLAAQQAQKVAPPERKGILREAALFLKAARPTAVNLAWAVDRMERFLEPHLWNPELSQIALSEAQAILNEDIASCQSIGRLGQELIPNGATVLTHCNAGALATGGYGTALGVIRAACEEGKQIRVIANETRPYLQGARLTAWELHRDKIDVTIISDNMAGFLMQKGEISCAIVGADRIARNGDVANKIGTYSVAVLCREHKLPFYVAAPRSTIDLDLPSGAKIPIEERSSEEVTVIGGKSYAPAGVRARYPAFDITPAKWVDAIITEKGIVRPCFEKNLAGLFL